MAIYCPCVSAVDLGSSKLGLFAEGSLSQQDEEGDECTREHFKQSFDVS